MGECVVLDQSTLEPLEVGKDCFVLTPDDLFSVQALWGLAHVIQTALELDASRRLFTAEERAYYGRLADRVADLAHQWSSRGQA